MRCTLPSEYMSVCVCVHIIITYRRGHVHTVTGERALGFNQDGHEQSLIKGQSAVTISTNGKGEERGVGFYLRLASS